jgi:hypothetical protein
MIVVLQIGRFANLIGLVAFLFTVLQGDVFAQSPKGRNSLQIVQERHKERFREFSNQIEKLAQFCDEKALTEAAAKVRSRVILPEPQSLRVDKLQMEIRPEILPGVTGDERYWQTQLRNLETEYAKDLYLQSRGALNQGYPSYAYNLVREAAIHDSDHPQVRRILGFVRTGSEWVTPFASAQKLKGNIWHEEFGWLPRSHVERYIAGERNFQGRWISAEKEKERRRDFGSAWEVRTDHYLIKTNVSLEKGVKMGKALEDFYVVFQETFAGFFNTPEQLKKLFDGTSKTVRADAKPYIVHFYRSRDEYVNRLKKDFPSIDQTNGVYMINDKTAHFYHDPANEHEGTLFHEATHQLFFESHDAKRAIGENHHFWIIEGIAGYMESFHRRNGSFSLGDPNYIRFVGARQNLLDKNYYVPLREFSGYGMLEFQRSPELAKNYTQAAGLTRFFMHYDKGRYREALVKHLSQLYSSDERTRERADSLEELTGVDFSDLDKQYAEDARKTEEKVSVR